MADKDEEKDDTNKAALVSEPQEVTIERGALSLAELAALSISKSGLKSKEPEQQSEQTDSAQMEMEEARVVSPRKTVTFLIEDETTFTEMTHPTGVFREAPQSTFEFPPSDTVEADRVIIPCSSPVRNPTLSPPATPTHSPRPDIRNWWYKIHCKKCCERAVSGDYRSCCMHYEPVSVEDLEVPITLSTGKVYGQTLQSACGEDGVQIPIVVQTCLDLIEEWATKNPGEAMSVYLTCGLPSDVNKIKEHFNQGEEDKVTLLNYDVHAISGALKLYLLQLADSVIPSAFYHSFLRSVRVYENYKSLTYNEYTVVELMAKVDQSSNATLKFILAHLGRLSWMDHTTARLATGATQKDQSSARNTFHKVVWAFGQILMRPPWDVIEDLEEKAHLHCEVLYDLLTDGYWQVVVPVFRKPRLRAPNISVESSLGSLISPDNHLLDAEWYWRHTSISKSLDMLEKKQSQSFLVVDYVNFQFPYDYALAVKVGTASVSIRIHYANGRYGFAEPYEWPSIVSLVCWHRCNHLELGPDKIKTLLKYPVRRDILPVRPNGDSTRESWNYAVINSMLAKKSKEYSYLSKWYTWLTYEVQVKDYATEALAAYIQTTNELIAINKAKVGEPADEEILENTNNLETRKTKIEAFKDALKPRVDKQYSKYSMIECELTTIRADIAMYFNYKRDWEEFLLSVGKSSRFLSFLSSCRLFDETVVSLSLRDESLWFINTTPDGAEKLLRGKRLGTFLIYPASNNPPATATADMPEDGAKADMPEDGAKADMPEDGAKADVPEDGAKADVPEDGAKAAVPEDGAKAAVPEDGAKAAVTEDGAKAAVTEDGAKAAMTEDGAKAAMTEDGAKAAATEDGAKAAVTEDGAKAAVTEDGAKAAVTEDGAKAAVAEDGAKAAVAEDGAKAAVAEDGAKAAVAEDGAKAAVAEDGAKAAVAEDGAKAAVAEDGAKAAVAEDGAKAAVAEDGAKAAVAEDGAKAAVAEDGAKAAVAEDGAKAAVAEDGAKAAVAEDGAKAAVAEDGAKAAVTEDGAKAAVTEGGAKAAVTEGGAKAAVTEGGAKAAVTEGGAKAAVTEGGAKAAVTEGGAKAAVTEDGAKAAVTEDGAKAADGAKTDVMAVGPLEMVSPKKITLSLFDIMAKRRTFPPASFRLLEETDAEYVLSIVLDDGVNHKSLRFTKCTTVDCSVKKHSEEGYTLTESSCPRFPTLLGFVMHFHRQPLSCYSNSLPVNLNVPVYWPDHSDQKPTKRA